MISLQNTAPICPCMSTVLTHCKTTTKLIKYFIVPLRAVCLLYLSYFNSLVEVGSRGAKKQSHLLRTECVYVRNFVVFHV